jgi:hypothetical protein
MSHAVNVRPGGPIPERDVMSTNHFVKLLLLASGGFFTTTAIFATLWLRERERGLRRLLERTEPQARSSADLEQLMHAVDAIAIEVERISEGQRFTTQVLAERQPAPIAIRQPERVITPH